MAGQTARIIRPRNNPLIEPSGLSYGAPAFDKICPEHFLPAVDYGIARAKAEIEAIKNNPSSPTFRNTIEALEFSGQDLSRIVGTIGVIAASNANQQINDLMKIIRQKLSDHGNDITFDAALFKRIKEVSDNKATRKQLTTEQERLLDVTYWNFAGAGTGLPPAQQQRLRDIDRELGQLSETFKTNMSQAKAAYRKLIDNEQDLDGVPQRLKDSFARAAQNEGQPGKWLVQDNANASFILTHGKNRNLRRELFTAFNKAASEGAWDNRPVILDIVRLRHEKAQILGFKNYAELALSSRMARDVKTVMDFLETNRRTYQPAADAHYKAVKDLAIRQDGINDFSGAWDFPYYERQLQEKNFNINLEELQAYFDLEKVLEGLRQHAEKLFNVRLAPADGRYPVYHPDVKVYEVKDKGSGNIIGLFYADYFERPGAKRDGAWANALRKRGLYGGQDQIPIVFNNANFTKADNGPTLLTLRQVRTIFHEFGHALHNLLAEGKYPTLTGTGVAWDFVELPSQLQENWIRKKEVLDSFARHYKTGQPIPPAMLDRIRDMENFGAGSDGKGQTFLGVLDMAWHTTDPKDIKSVEELEDKVRAQYGFGARVGGPRSPRFSHLFSGGYAAGYYSYKWAKVMEADIFDNLFEKNGIYDRATADRVRQLIYAPGGTQSASSLFNRLMGRDPDPHAMFRREGLQPAASNDNGKDDPDAGRNLQWQPPGPGL